LRTGKHEFDVSFQILFLAFKFPVSSPEGKQWPDLILLDIAMPQMDGFEVIRRLKGNPVTASIPVIFLTAKVQYEDIHAGYRAGADYYITIPFTESTLISCINMVLSSDRGR